jgi:hypothetical protein
LDTDTDTGRTDKGGLTVIIIYYRDKQTGKIKRVHENKPGHTMADLEPLISDYNRNGNTDTAGAVEVADDSLEAFLFGTRSQRARIDHEAVQDLISALEDALYNARFLED